MENAGCQEAAEMEDKGQAAGAGVGAAAVVFQPEPPTLDPSF